MRKIPFNKPVFDHEEFDNLKKVMDSGFVGQGPMTKEFEKEFAKFVGSKFGVATNSGTTAIQVALESMGLKKGDEVLVPAVSFVASANAIIHAKGKPVFVDIDPKNYCIDVSKIEEKITNKTKAITPVHLLGIPADIKPIKEICEKHNLKLMEDCALAHGAMYDHKQVGTFGDSSIFSFYGSKIIVSGEGGMILTDNEEYAKKMRLLRSHGNNPDKKFDHLIFGYSYQLSDLNSAVGLAQIKKLPNLLDKRRQNAKLMTKLLSDINSIQLYHDRPNTESAWFGFPVVIIDESIKRDDVVAELAKKGIETRPLYYIMPHLSFYKKKYGGSYPISESVTKNGFFMSCAPVLNNEDITYVCDGLRAALKWKK